MKNRFISGFLCGAVIFGAAGALAASYTVLDNPFPIQLNGKTVQIEGYNINDNTYLSCVISLRLSEALKSASRTVKSSFRQTATFIRSNRLKRRR